MVFHQIEVILSPDAAIQEPATAHIYLKLASTIEFSL